MERSSDGELLIGAVVACKVTGASYRQLDWWCRTGVLRIAVEARGSGSGRRLTRHQVVLVRALVVVAWVTKGSAMAGYAADLASIGPEKWHGKVLVHPGGIRRITSVKDLIPGIVVDLDACTKHVDEALSGAA